MRQHEIGDGLHLDPQRPGLIDDAANSHDALRAHVVELLDQEREGGFEQLGRVAGLSEAGSDLTESCVEHLEDFADGGAARTDLADLGDQLGQRFAELREGDGRGQRPAVQLIEIDPRLRNELAQGGVVLDPGLLDDGGQVLDDRADTVAGLLAFLGDGLGQLIADGYTDVASDVLGDLLEFWLAENPADHADQLAGQLAKLLADDRTDRAEGRADGATYLATDLRSDGAQALGDLAGEQIADARSEEAGDVARVGQALDALLQLVGEFFEGALVLLQRGALLSGSVGDCLQGGDDLWALLRQLLVGRIEFLHDAVQLARRDHAGGDRCRDFIQRFQRARDGLDAKLVDHVGELFEGIFDAAGGDRGGLELLLEFSDLLGQARVAKLGVLGFLLERFERVLELLGRAGAILEGFLQRVQLALEIIEGDQVQPSDRFGGLEGLQRLLAERGASGVERLLDGGLVLRDLGEFLLHPEQRFGEQVRCDAALFDHQEQRVDRLECLGLGGQADGPHGDVEPRGGECLLVDGVGDGVEAGRHRIGDGCQLAVLLLEAQDQLDEHAGRCGAGFDGDLDGVDLGDRVTDLDQAEQLDGVGDLLSCGRGGVAGGVDVVGGLLAVRTKLRHEAAAVAQGGAERVEFLSGEIAPLLEDGETGLEVLDFLVGQLGVLEPARQALITEAAPDVGEAFGLSCEIGGGRRGILERLGRVARDHLVEAFGQLADELGGGLQLRPEEIPDGVADGHDEIDDRGEHRAEQFEALDHQLEGAFRQGEKESADRDYEIPERFEGKQRHADGDRDPDRARQESNDGAQGAGDPAAASEAQAEYLGGLGELTESVAALHALGQEVGQHAVGEDVHALGRTLGGEPDALEAEALGEQGGDRSEGGDQGSGDQQERSGGRGHGEERQDGGAHRLGQLAEGLGQLAGALHPRLDEIEGVAQHREQRQPELDGDVSQLVAQDHELAGEGLVSFLGLLGERGVFLERFVALIEGAAEQIAGVGQRKKRALEPLVFEAQVGEDLERLVSRCPETFDERCKRSGRILLEGGSELVGRHAGGVGECC